jgi:hypothetical protein
MRRWLVASLALLAAAGAVYLLLSFPELVSLRSEDHGEIDPESRARLREVLREELAD